jgi:hypothetical protein
MDFPSTSANNFRDFSFESPPFMFFGQKNRFLSLFKVIIFIYLLKIICAFVLVAIILEKAVENRIHI